MNLNQNFKAERAVAQHCAELTRAGPRPEEREVCLAAWRKDVCEELVLGFSELLAGEKLTVQVSAPETMKGQAVYERIGPVAANCLIRIGTGDQIALISFGLETAIELTDRSFGGSGEMVLDPVAALPRSANLLIEEVARTVAKAIARIGARTSARTSARTGDPQDFAADVIVHSLNATRLKAWEPEDDCAFMEIEIAGEDAISWTGRLAMAVEQFDSILLGAGTPREPGADTGSGSDQVFAAIPLPIEAVLAEFDLSLERLETLAPGDCIGLSVAREIPLRIADTVFAQGTLGTIEDRMALRLTSVMPAGAFA